MLNDKVRMAECHPDRLHYAKSMCKNCYKKTKPPSDESRKKQSRWFKEVYYPAKKQYYADKSRQWRSIPSNREKASKLQAEAWKMKPERRRSRRNHYFKWKYGITVEQRDEIMSQNGGLCMICNQQTSTHLDHCHKTGEIRGALCHMCNKGLGHFRDNSELLRSAISYLKGKQ